MRGYLVSSPVAMVLLNERGEIITYERWPSNPEEAAEEMLSLEEGRVPPTLKSLLSRINGNLRELVVENPDLGRSIAQHFKGEVLVKPNNEVGVIFRERVLTYMSKLGIDENRYKTICYEVSLRLARRKVRRAVEKRDLFIAQAIAALDDINKTLNLFASRVREWYGLHFPELDEILDEHEDYAKVVSHIGLRSAVSKDRILELGFDEETADRILSAANSSMGADMTDFDLNAIKMISDSTLQLFEIREKLEKYIDEAMMEVAPNIRGLVGSLIGARLIALAGGLAKLAAMPASTVQVLGAEKALFRALRTGGKPPKHGIIFQHPAIHKSPKWQRGKIARALAAKLAIAARIDAFTGEYKADELKEQLEQRIEEIKTLYPKPPKRQSQPPPVKREGKKKGRKH